MKIIFLDIDGVLNHEIFFRERVKDPNITGEICKNSIKLLNYIIEKTEALVVVSSTWRYGRTLEELQELLDAVGFKGEVIGKTPILPESGDYLIRGNEILKYIIDHKDELGFYFEYDKYVILDDDCDMLYQQKDNFIHIDRYIGITPNDADLAIKILNK